MAGVKKKKKNGAPPAAQVKTYLVVAPITISVHTSVKASSPEEAKEIALQRGFMSFCWQCAGYEDDDVWCINGELDGSIDDQQDIDVTELTE